MQQLRILDLIDYSHVLNELRAVTLLFVPSGFINVHLKRSFANILLLQTQPPPLESKKKVGEHPAFTDPTSSLREQEEGR
jgi:hypothetical protein